MKVYVLGAGASCHVGYPLSSTMKSALFSWMRSKTDSVLEYPIVADWLDDTFTTTEDVETLVTDIDRVIDYYKTGTLEQRMQRAAAPWNRFVIQQAIREWFTEISAGQAVDYAKFAEIVSPGDVIITFNYDVSVERELHRFDRWEVGDGYGFQIDGLAANSRTKVLKLHGSVSWLEILFNSDRPVVPSADLSLLGYEKSLDPKFPDRSAALPVMILPSRTKRFESSFWHSLWDQAAAAVRSAEALCILGFSLRAIDRKACELLLQCASKQIPVCVACGNDTQRVAKDFYSAGYINVQEPQHTFFNEWVTSMRANVGV